MSSRSISWPVWAGALAAAGLGAWALHAYLSPTGSEAVRVAPASSAASQPVDAAVLAASVPASAAEPAVAEARFKLAGILNKDGQGLAMISVDGAPARMFRVGETVQGDVIVRSLTSRGVELGARDGTSIVALEVAPASLPAAVPVGVAPRLPRAANSAPLYDGSLRAQEALRQAGSKHAPLVPPAQQPPSQSAGPLPAAAPVDDGRWRPAGKP